MSGSEHSIMFFQAPIFEERDWQLALMSLSGLYFCRVFVFDFGDDSCLGIALSSNESILVRESFVILFMVTLYWLVFGTEQSKAMRL